MGLPVPRHGRGFRADRRHKPRTLRGELRDSLLERTRRDFTLRGLVIELAGWGGRSTIVRFGSSSMPKGASKNSVLPAEELRPKVARRREQWRKCQGRLDPRRLVSIDETWAKTNMATLRGWAP